MSKQAKRARQQANRLARREAEVAAQKRAARTRALRNVLVVGVVLVAAVVGLSLLRSGGDSAEAGVRCTDEPADPPVVGLQSEQPPEMALDLTHTYQAIVDTSCGEFTIDLDPRTAPQSVNSFVALARSGFYDQLTFYRVVEDFVIQGGDPAGAGYTLPDEPPADGYRKGSVALANAGPGTSSSDFFVTLSDAAGSALMRNGGPPYLYSSLGEVTSGMEVVDKLGSFAGPGERPTRELAIFSIEIVERDASGAVVTTTSPPATTTTTAAPAG